MAFSPEPEGLVGLSFPIPSLGVALGHLEEEFAKLVEGFKRMRKKRSGVQNLQILQPFVLLEVPFVQP